MNIKEIFYPQSFNEAYDLLISYPGPLKFLAGGTDLLIQLSDNECPASGIISLKNISELKEIRRNEEAKIFIGSMARHADVAQSSLINRHFPALAKASSLMGSPSIRNMGTIGGNICNASPSAETAPPLMIYEAGVLVWSSSEEKEIAIENFFTGPSMNILEKGEILKGFVLKPDEESVSDYEKLGIRKAMEIAIVNTAVSIVIEKNRCRQARIALGAVAPTPVRAKKAEKALQKKKMTPELIERAAELAAGETKPISDIRASAEYRKKMTRIIVKRILTKLSVMSEV